MECPNCKQELAIEDHVIPHVDRYDSVSIASAFCCDTLVTVRTVRAYKATPYTGSQLKDDWGD